VPDRVKVLYIACVPHSGSTILGNVLGEVPGFFSAGELFYTTHVIKRGLPCGCGMLPLSCPLWTRVLSGAGLTFQDLIPDDSWLVARYLPRLLAHERRGLPEPLADYQAVLERFYRSIQQTTECRVIVDGSKSPAYGRLLQTAPSIDLYVVHLVRDPFATAFSWRRKQNRLNMHPAKFGLLWSFWNTSIEALWKRDSERYLAVRYEDFVGRPGETIRRIARFVGEYPGDLPFLVDGETGVELGPNHTIAGNENRFRSGRIALRLDDEWKRTTAVRDSVATASVTWPFQHRYGYRFPRRFPTASARG
jgi:hypothetical protein